MSKQNISIGFPIMSEEPGERRAFLPHFIQQLAKIGFEIVLEEDYGLTLEFTLEGLSRRLRQYSPGDTRRDFQTGLCPDSAFSA